MRVILTERGERSVSELMFSWAAHERWEASGPLTTFGRITPAIVRSGGATAYVVLPHIAAIAEEYSRSMLLACSEPLVPQDRPILQDLWRQAEFAAEGSWGGQEKAWLTWHGVDLKGSNEYRKFQPVIEARNAIAHGLGSLTKRQVRKDGGKAVIERLKSVHIATSGTRLVLSDTALKNCLNVARDFIEWLDKEIQGKCLLIIATSY